MNCRRDPLFIGKLNASSYKKEPVQAFAPSTIRLEGDALCDAMRKSKPRVSSATGRLSHYGQPEGKGDIDCLQVML